jgi:hypothetical protein
MTSPTSPTAPEGVVLNTTTGPVPVALTYVGVRADGIHVWHADTAVPLGQVVSLTADLVPARTTIQLCTGVAR